MPNSVQELVLILFAYVFTLLILILFWAINDFLTIHRHEDNIIIDIENWRQIYIENSSLKKDKEILTMENLRLERIYNDYVDDLKYYSK